MSSNHNNLTKVQIEKLSKEILWQFVQKVILIALPFLAIYMYSYTIEENKNLFNNDKVLICNVSDMKFEVSKLDNWYINRDDFVKDGSRILAFYCEEF